METKLVVTTSTLIDLSGESPPIPMGTIARFVSDEEDYAILELLDGTKSFPCDFTEFLFVVNQEELPELMGAS